MGDVVTEKMQAAADVLDRKLSKEAASAKKELGRMRTTFLLLSMICGPDDWAVLWGGFKASVDSDVGELARSVEEAKRQPF